MQQKTFWTQVFCGADGQGSFTRVAAAVVLFIICVISIGVHRFGWILNTEVFTQLNILFMGLVGKALWENLKGLNPNSNNTNNTQNEKKN